MSPFEIAAWNRFTQVAIGQLEEYKVFQDVLGYSTDPAFDNWERLYVSERNGKYKWTYVVWKRSDDSRRIHNSKAEMEALILGQQIPLIEKFTGELPDDFYQDLGPMLERLSLKPFLPRTHFGLDGISYSLGFGSFWHNSRFSWWNRLPDAWQDLQAILKLVEANLAIAREAGVWNS